jgi:hypothetical protein
MVGGFPNVDDGHTERHTFHDLRDEDAIEGSTGPDKGMYDTDGRRSDEHRAARKPALSVQSEAAGR